jgi:hypothetical protein
MLLLLQHIQWINVKHVAFWLVWTWNSKHFRITSIQKYYINFVCLHLNYEIFQWCIRLQTILICIDCCSYASFYASYILSRDNITSLGHEYRVSKAYSINSNHFLIIGTGGTGQFHKFFFDFQRWFLDEKETKKLFVDINDLGSSSACFSIWVRTNN